jgi:hypothetical protein
MSLLRQEFRRLSMFLSVGSENPYCCTLHRYVVVVVVNVMDDGMVWSTYVQIYLTDTLSLQRRKSLQKEENLDFREVAFLTHACMHKYSK